MQRRVCRESLNITPREYHDGEHMTINSVLWLVHGFHMKGKSRGWKSNHVPNLTCAYQGGFNVVRNKEVNKAPCTSIRWYVPWALWYMPWALWHMPWALWHMPWALWHMPWALWHMPWALRVYRAVHIQPIITRVSTVMDHMSSPAPPASIKLCLQAAGSLINRPHVSDSQMA